MIESDLVEPAWYSRSKMLHNSMECSLLDGMQIQELVEAHVCVVTNLEWSSLIGTRTKRAVEGTPGG